MPSKSNNLAHKQKALDYFQSRVLGSPKRNEVLKMYLFGSMLDRRKVRAESDIDVVVFSKRQKPSRQLEDIINTESFEGILKYGQRVEPLLYPVNRLRQPKSAFLMQVIQEGKELYSAV